MRQKLLYLLLVTCAFFAMPATINAQKFNNCGFDTYYQLRGLEKKSLVNSSRSLNCTGPFNIPVIVHVVHSENITNSDANWSDNNLSEWQVYNYLNLVNTLLAGANPQMDITLRPACKNNTGATTKAVVWHPNDDFTTIDMNPASGDDENMKNMYNNQSGSTTPTTQYLHIWVVDEIINSTQINNGSGIAGYATFPSSNGLATDGIVIENDFFIDPSGNNSNALVLAHEIGHYLGLYHTFEGQCNSADQCDDTPPDNDQEGTSNCSPINSCHLPSENPDVNDLPDNIMDYSNFVNCLTRLTDCQYTRMHNALCDVRTGLNTSQGLNCNCANPVNFSFTVTSSSGCPSFQTINITPATLPAGYSINWTLNGLPLSLGPGNTFNLTTPGEYVLTGELTNGTADCRRIFSRKITVYVPNNLNFNIGYTPNPLQTQNPTNFYIVAPQAGVTYTWNIEGSSYTGASINHPVTGSGCITVTVTASTGTCSDTKTFTTSCSCPSNIGFESGNPDGYQFTGNNANVSILNGPVNDPVLGNINPRFGNGFIRIGNDLPSTPPDNDRVTFTYTPTANSDRLIISVHGYVQDGHSYSPGSPQNPAMFGFDVNPLGFPGFSGSGYLNCNYTDFVGVQNLPAPNQSFNTGTNAIQGGGIIRLNGWRDYEINLACFVGVPVEIVLYARDCYDGQHNAKAYFDFSCANAEPVIQKTFLPDVISICKGKASQYFNLNNGCNYTDVSFTPTQGVFFESINKRFYFNPTVTTTYTVTYNNGNCQPVSETIEVIVKESSLYINAGGTVTRDICANTNNYVPGLMVLPPAIVPPGVLFHYEWYNSGNSTPSPAEYIPNSNVASLNYTLPVNHPQGVNPYYFIRKLVLDSPYDSCYEGFAEYRFRRVSPSYNYVSDIDTCENSNISFGIRYNYFGGANYQYTSFSLIDAANPGTPIVTIPNPPQALNQWHTINFNFFVQSNVQYRIVSNYLLFNSGMNCSETGAILPIDAFPRIGNPGSIAAPVTCYTNPFTPITLTGTPALTLAGTTTTNFVYQWEYSVDFQASWIPLGGLQTSASPFVFNPTAPIPPGSIIVIRRKAINPYCEEEMLSNYIILRPVYNLTNMIQCPPSTCYTAGSSVTITGNDLVAGLEAYGCTGGYYEWFTSTDGFNYTPVPNSNVKDLTITISGTLHVKRRFVCGNCYDKTAECTIEVLVINPGSIPAAVTIGSGATTITVNSIQPASVTPASSENCINWYYATNINGPYTIISNNTAADPNNLQWVLPAGLPVTFYLKREILASCIFPDSCNAASNICTVSYNVINPGTISSSVAGFCELKGTINIHSVSPATAPAGCAISYLWQYQKNNGAWSTALGTNTNESYDFNIALYAATLADGDIICFRRKATAVCKTTILEGYSNTRCLQYCRKQGTFTIGYNQFSCTIPYTPAAFVVTASPVINCPNILCNDGAISYRWQESVNGTTFTNIDNAYGATYTAPVFTQYATKYYRLVRSCHRFYCSDTSNVVAIIVNNKQPNNPGQIGYNQTLPVGQVPNMIISTAPHFCNCTTPTFYWLRKIGNGSWVSLANVSGEYFAPPTSTFPVTVYYQRQMICGPLANLYSNTVAITFTNEGLIGKSALPNTTSGAQEQTPVITIVPVPAKDMIRLFVRSEAGKPVNIRFTNITGTEVLPALNRVLPLADGIPINTGKLAPGIYVATLTTPGSKRPQMAKFVIAR
ncbi:MAG: hypothetical protein JNM68_14270 [Dinghuibacter sp.]|nr:hypothetical protein [Dinghuibacter sp.]